MPKTRMLVGLFAVVFLGVGAALVLIAADQRERDAALDDRGVEVPATVLASSFQDSADSEGTTELRVRFVVRGDAQRRVQTDLTTDGHLSASRGDTLRIEYDARDPRTARLAGDGDDGSEQRFAGIVFVLVGVGIVLWLLFPEIVRRIPLLRRTLPEA